MVQMASDKQKTTNKKKEPDSYEGERRERVCLFCRQLKQVRHASRSGSVSNSSVCDEDAEKRGFKWKDNFGWER